MTDTVLYPKKPYDFHLSAMIFASGDPWIRRYNRGIFRQVLEIGETPALVTVFSKGTTEEPRLHISVITQEPHSESMIRAACTIVSSLFNLSEDLTPFYQAMKKDAVMAGLVRRLRGLKAPTTPTIFEALVDSVIEQQISLKAAHSIENRLIRATGTALTLDGNTYYGYPSPYNLEKTPDSTFRACGLTVRKGEYIREISRKILEGTLDLERFKTFPDTEPIISELMKVRGIGRWTAELTILRGLHRPDAFPADDVGVRRFISNVYHNGEKISPADARLFAHQWGDWKGFAAYYLEIADLMGFFRENKKTKPPDPESGILERNKKP